MPAPDAPPTVDVVEPDDRGTVVEVVDVDCVVDVPVVVVVVVVVGEGPVVVGGGRTGVVVVVVLDGTVVVVVEVTGTTWSCSPFAPVMSEPGEYAVRGG